MKLLLELMLISVALSNEPTCNSHLLRSFGLQSMNNPNKKNTLCPFIKQNCCTDKDTVFMLKWYQEKNKPELDLLYQKFPQHIIDLRQIKNQVRSTFKWSEIWTYYKVQKLPNNHKFTEHLEKLWKFITNPDEVQEEPIKEFQESLLKHITVIKKVRQAFPCQLCDYATHQAIDVENQTITFSEAFCTDFIQAHQETLKTIFIRILKPILAFEELLYYLTYIRLITDPNDRAIAYNAIQHLQECEKDTAKCLNVCKEFKLNSPTLVFDGKPQFFQDLIANYNQYKHLLLDVKKIPDLFKEREKKLKEIQSKIEKQEDKTVPSYNFLQNIPIDSIRTDSIKMNNLPWSVIQQQKNSKPITSDLKAYEDETVVFKVFKTIAKPLQIGFYTTLFSQSQGLHPIKQSQEIDMEISAQELVSVMVKENAPKEKQQIPMNEAVQLLVKSMSIQKISNFLNDINFSITKVQIEDVRKEEAAVKGVVEVAQSRLLFSSAFTASIVNFTMALLLAL